MKVAFLSITMLLGLAWASFGCMHIRPSNEPSPGVKNKTESGQPDTALPQACNEYGVLVRKVVVKDLALERGQPVQICGLPGESPEEPSVAEVDISPNESRPDVGPGDAGQDPDAAQGDNGQTAKALETSATLVVRPYGSKIWTHGDPMTVPEEAVAYWRNPQPASREFFPGTWTYDSDHEPASDAHLTIDDELYTVWRIAALCEILDEEDLADLACGPMLPDRYSFIGGQGAYVDGKLEIRFTDFLGVAIQQPDPSARQTIRERHSFIGYKCGFEAMCIKGMGILLRSR